MKFGEKLTELRKKEGLSQEELGYKLNVTRQTVSKWELGQTTPEMDKLVELGKIFNISVDELVSETGTISNENEVIQDAPVKEKSSRSDKRSLIIIIAIVVIFVAIVIYIFTIPFRLANKAVEDMQGMAENIIGSENDKGGVFDKFFGIFDKATDIIDENMDSMNQKNEEFNKTKFNSTLEMYNGTKAGLHVSSLLDSVITSNKKEDRKITVKYKDIKTQDETEIRNVKQKIETSNNYEVSMEYDADGYIYEITIERVISEFEVKQFNGFIELYSGSKSGLQVKTLLDNVITSNKKEDRKITVKYKNTKTQKESEIKNIKKKIDTFDDLEVSMEYDEDGFIYEVVIENA